MKLKDLNKERSFYAGRQINSSYYTTMKTNLVCPICSYNAKSWIRSSDITSQKNSFSPQLCPKHRVALINLGYEMKLPKKLSKNRKILMKLL